MLPKVRGWLPTRLVSRCSEAGEKRKRENHLFTLPLALPSLIQDLLWSAGAQSGGDGSLEQLGQPVIMQVVAEERPGRDRWADSPGGCTACQPSIGIIIYFLNIYIYLFI